VLAEIFADHRSEPLPDFLGLMPGSFFTGTAYSSIYDIGRQRLASTVQFPLDKLLEIVFKGEAGGLRLCQQTGFEPLSYRTRAASSKLGRDSTSAMRCCLNTAVSCSTKPVGGNGDPSGPSGKLISFPRIDS